MSRETQADNATTVAFAAESPSNYQRSVWARGATHMARSAWLPAVSFACSLIAWQIAAYAFGAHYVPGPVPVVKALAGLFYDGSVSGNLFPTLLRVVGGFALAEVIGVFLGMIMGLSKAGEKFLELDVMIALTIPSLCYIIISFLWLGLTNIAAIVAIGLTTFPIITINVWSGVKSIDRNLVDMARVFRVNRRDQIFRVVFPQIMPYIVAATRYGFGVAWKVTIFVELLGLSNGVGFQLNYSFQVFNMTNVFAWTLLFTIVMLALEILIFKPVEQWVFRWRPDN